MFFCVIVKILKTKKKNLLKKNLACKSEEMSFLKRNFYYCNVIAIYYISLKSNWRYKFEIPKSQTLYFHAIAHVNCTAWAMCLPRSIFFLTKTNKHLLAQSQQEKL